MKKLNIYYKNIALFTAIILVISCAVNPVTGKKQLMFMSEAQEVELGKQYDPEVIATFGEYKNDKLLSFVQARGTEMGKISHRPKIEYHIKIVDSPVINAFAVPGGYIYLTRGIMAQFNNEAELTGVLAHEMGHITARHTASQQSKQQMGQLLLIGGMMASKELQKYAEYAMQGMQLLFLSFSRDDEREADRLGVEYSSKIGYDAHKMADFFQVLMKMNLASDQAGIPTFMSTHPDPGDRLNSVNQKATEWQEKLKLPAYKVNAESYLQMIDGMIYGEDPRQGYVAGNTFYHPDLKFQFSVPDGWQLENSPLQVRMAPKDGKALIMFAITPQKTLEEAVKSSMEQLGLTLTENKKINVNGMPALVTISKQVTQDESTGQQNTIMVLSYFIDYNSTFYVFHGVSAESDFSSFMPVMGIPMSNFSKLTDPAKLNVQAKKVLVKKVQRTGTLAETFQSFGVQPKQMDEFALLNNMALTDKLQAGKLIKIIGE